MRSLLFLFLVGVMGCWAEGSGRLIAVRAAQDFKLTANADAPVWRGNQSVFLTSGPMGQKVSGHQTEVRARWTPDYLYLLFVCPYEELYSKPNLSTTEETNKLWEWDVAETFIGWDFDNIHQYKELQVSPQGGFVDLDIDRKKPKPGGGWQWNSGFEVKAQIDTARKVWTGAMKIPYSAIDPKPAEAGRELRINLYRIQGPPPHRIFLAWQPTGQPSYHVPEAFGRLVLR